MARIDRIKHRLDNWALWKSRMLSGCNGWASQNILATAGEADVWNRGSYGGSFIPAFDEDAQEIDAAIKSFEATRPHLVQTLDVVYLRDHGIKTAALTLGCAEATVHARLGQADRAIEDWLLDQAKIKDRRKAAAEAERVQEQRRWDAGKTFTP